MDLKILEKKKGAVEVQFNEKEIPVALAGVLGAKGVDAYWYETHPLKKDFRLRVTADDAMGELRKAVDDLEKSWSQFEKAATAKLK